MSKKVTIYFLETGEPKTCEKVDADECVAMGAYAWEMPEIAEDAEIVEDVKKVTRARKVLK